MGWEQDFLQQAVNTCTNPSGLIQDCPLFNVVDESVATQCHLEDMPAHLRKEDGNGPFAKLPGGGSAGSSPSSGGHGHGKPSNTATQGAAAPTLPYQPGVTAPSKASPLPGQVFKEDGANGSSGYNADAIEPAVTPAPGVKAADVGAEFVSTQYITVGNVVSEILWKQAVVTVTAEPEPSTTVTVTATGPRPVKHRRSGHGHSHGHAHVHGQGQL
jgi:hypothetical protein